MELLTQTEVLKELNKYSKYEITRSSFTKRVKKGQIPIHYKPTSKKKFYKLNEVAKIYNIKISDIEANTPTKVKKIVIFTLQRI